jgi:hypothetical protein
MNFLGIDVSDLDPRGFFQWARMSYLLAYLVWVALVWWSRRRIALLGPLALGLVTWFATTFPLQRAYGLGQGTDRMRNLWWCATAAAGLPPWESGVVDRRALEPAWSLFVSLVALREPGRVAALYPFLPALAIVAVGLAIPWSFLRLAPADAFVDGMGTERWGAALWCGFFVLLASMEPTDFMNPYRGFWAKSFLLKPNHVLAFALVPPIAALMARARTLRDWLASALLLGLLGWVFVTYWALFCWGVCLYTLWTFTSGKQDRAASIRVAATLAAGLVIVLPYLYYLLHQFPETMSMQVGTFADDPRMSVWGDTPPRAQSLLLLVTLDLGASFYFALYGLWTSLRRQTRFDRLWVGLVVGAYAAWLVNSYLLFTGRARQSDEIYYFLVFVVSIEAGIGACRLTSRLAALAGSTETPSWKAIAQRDRLSALAFLVALPATVGWWWNPLTMDAHFRVALDPLPRAAVQVGDFLRENTRRDGVVLAAGETAMWIPALTGRRIVYDDDLDRVRSLAASAVLTNVLVDPTAVSGVAVDAETAARRRALWTFLASRARLDRVLQAGAVEVYSVRYPSPRQRSALSDEGESRRRSPTVAGSTLR